MVWSVITQSPGRPAKRPASRRHGHVHRRDRIRPEHELGIAERAHFGDVQSGQFVLRGDTLANHVVDDVVRRVGQPKDESHQRAHANQLRDKLARVAVEQSTNRAVDTIPAAAVV